MVPVATEAKKETDALQAIIIEETVRHQNDIDAAVDAAMRRISRLPDYREYVADLVREAIRGRIGHVRHASNMNMRRECGGFDTKAKVTMGAVTSKIAYGVYNYAIAGRTLGIIKGEELLPIAEEEASRATGHMFNAKLCRKLAERVGKGKLVRECVKEAELRKIFEELT